MENEIIKIETNSEGKQTVDARELHEFLESKQQFGNWIKNRIDQYGFVQDIDFISFNNSMKADNTYINTKEYHLSIDMAKEISMVEKNEKGKQARQYFIQIQNKAEKILKEIEHIDYTGNINDLVFHKNSRALTNSRIIAEKFEKEHKNVLQIIDTLINNNIESDKINNFNQLNFTLVEYLDAKGELRKAYELTEEGFSLIALSFTGQKSLEFKIDFINAFFQMRTALMNRIKSEVIRNVLPQTIGKRGFVYIIGNNENDYIKIGVAQDVESRLKQLQTGSWAELYIEYRSMVCSNSFNIENNIHKKLDDYKVKGEWYDITVEEAIDLIEQENHTLDSNFIDDYYENNNIKFFKAPKAA